MKKFIYRTKWLVIRPQAFAAWARIHTSEHISLAQILAEQEENRRRIVSHAYMHTAFYRDFYRDVGFELGDMGQLGWFEKLPIVTKQHLREHFDDFVDSTKRRFLKISTTGGSTGVPTKVGYDCRIPEEVYSWRLQGWFGVHPWDDHAYVWRDTKSSKIAKFTNALFWWPTKHLKMDATFITDEKMAVFIRKYNALKPMLLQGYVGAIAQLAKYVLDNGLSVHAPKFVWTTSAPLPDFQRRMIASAFNAPICDQYGSCELRWIASQCPECGGLHVNTEHVHIEFVDAANNPVNRGEYGRTLLTNLEDTVFPLIRYENGDRGRWLTGACECGRTLPVIDSVKGRESESFLLPSGRTINGEFLTTIFDGAPDLVLGFRVVQHKDLNITIEYIPAKEDEPVISILRSFAERIGDEVQIDFKRVEHIEHDRGKSRFVVREK